MDNARITRPNFALPLPAQWPSQTVVFEKPVYLASCAPTLVAIKQAHVTSIDRRQTNAKLDRYLWKVPLKDLYPTREQAVAATSEKFKNRLHEANLRVARALLAVDDLTLRSLDFHMKEGLTPPPMESMLSKTVDQLRVLVAADNQELDSCLNDLEDNENEEDL